MPRNITRKHISNITSALNIISNFVVKGKMNALFLQSMFLQSLFLQSNSNMIKPSYSIRGNRQAICIHQIHILKSVTECKDNPVILDELYEPTATNCYYLKRKN